MYTWFLSILFLMLLNNQTVVFSSEGRDIKNNVIAIVNGEKITQEEIDSRMKNLVETDPVTYSSIQQEIINQLITNKLLDEFIDKQGIIVTQLEIERELNKSKLDIMGKQNGSGETLEQFLLSIGSNIYDFKESIKHGIALEKYFENRLDEKTLKKYFEDNKNLFNGESVKISHILIDTTEMKTQDQVSQALELIKSIKKKIDQGVNFEELAKKYSDCPSRENGGNLGFIQGQNNISSPFYDAVISLRVGQVSDPVRTGYGYHLIKVTEKKAGVNVQYGDVKDAVYTKVLDMKILELLEKLRENAHIIIR